MSLGKWMAKYGNKAKEVLADTPGKVFGHGPAGAESFLLRDKPEPGLINKAKNFVTESPLHAGAAAAGAGLGGAGLGALFGGEEDDPSEEDIDGMVEDNRQKEAEIAMMLKKMGIK